MTFFVRRGINFAAMLFDTYPIVIANISLNWAAEFVDH